MLPLHELKVSLREAELNPLASLGICLRLEVVAHALELFLAHDLCLEYKLVAVEFMFLRELVIPPILNALQAGLNCVRKRANDVGF